MALTLVEEVAAVLRDYMDEPSTAWIDNGRLQRFLEQGYAEFRSAIAKIDPSVFTASVDITLNNAFTYDLSSTGPEAVTILGPTPTNTRMVRIRDVHLADSTTGEPTYIFHHAASLRELKAKWNSGWDESLCMLDGSLLRFSTAVNETITIRYLPESTVDWSQINVGDNEYIDDLVDWHDLIALYAYKQYEIMDQSRNPTIAEQRERRLMEFAEYVTERDEAAGDHVHRTWDI